MTDIRQYDATTQVIRRLDRALREWIRPAEVRDAVDLAVASRAIGGEPVPFETGTAGDFRPLSPGDPWGRAWDTVWLHITGAVPQEWSADSPLCARTRLEADIDLGFTDTQTGFQAEALAYSASGALLKGINPKNRRVGVRARAGEAVEYWVEAAANPTLNSPTGTDLIPLAHLGGWESAGEACQYRFGGARLVLRDLEVEGLLADIAVLRGIATVQGTEPRRRAQIAAAFQRMLAVLDPQAVSRTAERARGELADVLAQPAHASAMRIAAVGHAHIDSAWLWPLRETVRKCARTFSNVVTLMESNPDFVFACSSAQQFQWMKEHYPELFERIRQRVSAGQFVPVGGMWVESDTNMPSGESMARQFIAGQGFFLREFGHQCDEVWLPDSFGYSGALPQIARAGGARWFFGQKMSWNQTNRMPHHTFEWEGIDGTRIFTHFTPVDTYNSDLSPEELRYASDNFADHGQFSSGIVPFGFGDGGGGPTFEMLEAGRRAASAEGLPRVAFSSPADFFTAAEAEAEDPAVWRGEMYLELHRGTYTSQSRTKRGNRRSESLLRQAELWCTTASLRTDFPYPAERLSSLWERTLLLQFHDILPGSSISWVHADAERLHAETEVELTAIIDQAIRALVGHGKRTLIANAAPHAVGGVDALAIAPAIGTAPPSAVERQGEDWVVSNDLVTLVIASDGRFTSLIDHSDGFEYFSAQFPANALHLHQDIPTDWDAWDIDEHYRGLTIPTEATAQIQVLPTADGVTITRNLGDSSVSQTVRLTAGSPGVDITSTVEWHEKQRLLKLAFPFAVDAHESLAETQFGYLTRPIHENTSWDAARFEIVAHRWMHVSDGGHGAGVVNDSTYGHDVTRLRDEDAGRYLTQVRQTLLRAPLYPDPTSDQGTHTFRTRIVPGASPTAAIAAAYEVDTALLEVQGERSVAPIAGVTGDGVVLHTVKLAEDGSGDVIVRAYESLGKPTRARISIEADEVWTVDLLERPVGKQMVVDRDGIEVDLRAFEFVTLRARARR